MSHEATAKGICQCSKLAGCSTASEIDHNQACVFWLWPKVAAALAEATRDVINRWNEALADRDAEIAQLSAKLAEAERDEWPLSITTPLTHKYGERSDKLKAERDAAEAKGVIAFIRQEEVIRESWRSYQGGLTFGEFAVEQIAKAGKS